MGDYWKQVHSRAVAASRQDLGLGSWKKIMIKGVIGGAIILALALWGSGDASGDEIVVRVSLIAVAIFLFPLVYLINFATIPPKLAAEADKRLSAASAEQSLPNAFVKSLSETQAKTEALEQQMVFISNLFEQYGRLIEACFTHAQFRGDNLRDSDIGLVAQFLNDEIKKVTPQLPFRPKEPLIFQTGWNRYRYILSAPMRIPPRVSFQNLSTDIEANVKRVSKLDFEVQFFHKPSLNKKVVPPQPFVANAEL